MKKLMKFKKKISCSSIDENQRPIFLQNPLSFLIDNPFSGTATMDNIKQINNLYELMKKGISQQNVILIIIILIIIIKGQNNFGKHFVCFKTVTENNNSNEGIFVNLNNGNVSNNNNGQFDNCNQKNFYFLFLEKKSLILLEWMNLLKIILLILILIKILILLNITI